MQTEAGRVALVAGASGMVGKELVRSLSADGSYRRVIALSRRPLTYDARSVVNRIVSFASFENDLRGLSCDEAFCCLGTTIKEAGSEQDFRLIDHDLVLRFAHFAQSAGAKTLLAVSSASASSESRNFYLRVKGETELALIALRFRSLHLMQPSLLLGARRDWRPAEALARALMPLANPLLLGRYEQWRAIPASMVARAMVAAAALGIPGNHRHTWRALRSLAIDGRLPK